MFEDDGQKFVIKVSGQEARELFRAQADKQKRRAESIRELASKLTPHHLLGEDMDPELLEEVKQTYGSSSLNNVKNARDTLNEKARGLEQKAALLAFIADHLGREDQIVSGRELERWGLFD